MCSPGEVVERQANGRRVTSIAIDPARAPLVRLAFDLAATGDHSLSEITDILEQAGLTTRPTPSRRTSPRRRSRRQLADRRPTAAVTAGNGRPKANPSPVVAGQGSHKDELAGRST